MDTEGRNESLGWSDLIGMGVTTAGVITVGVVVGLVVDHLLGTLPIFLFVGLLLGIAGAVSYLVSKFRKYLIKN
ncbi:MAG TPA: AtpZ/AtpI family protein [Jatrophihabitans sp.]